MKEYRKPIAEFIEYPGKGIIVTSEEPTEDDLETGRGSILNSNRRRSEW